MVIILWLKFYSVIKITPDANILILNSKLEGDVLMITSGNNALNNECPTAGTDESQ